MVKLKPVTARREAAARKGSTGAADATTTATHLDEPLVENLNRLQMEEDSARSVGEAIHVLGGKPAKEDKHPEKRLQAAYKAFEERMMPRSEPNNKITLKCRGSRAGQREGGTVVRSHMPEATTTQPRQIPPKSPPLIYQMHHNPLYHLRLHSSLFTCTGGNNHPKFRLNHNY